jgi:phospho-N-acetylmuramoyl-pentapeptide-transferase
MNNVGLVAFLAMLLFFVDWCSWKIVRLPLDSFYLTRPFLISAVLSALAGFLFAPVADSLKIQHFRRRGKSVSPSSRKPTPAMGGLFFVPIGIFVARREVGSNSNGVNGAAMITLIFAMLGLLDDISSLATDCNRKIPQWIRFLVQVSCSFPKRGSANMMSVHVTLNLTFKLFLRVLQIVAGIYFSIWLGSADISTPYSM